jgi:hypothetical protein
MCAGGDWNGGADCTSTEGYWSMSIEIKSWLVLVVAAGVSFHVDVRHGMPALIRHDRDVNDHVRRAREPQFRCIASLQVRITPELRRRRGTGVLIAPQWLLTCAHVAKIDDQESADDHDWEIAGTSQHPEKIVIHPSFRVDRDADVLSNGWDLALVKLSKPIAGVAPAVIYSDQDEVGKTGTLVGYGRIGDGKAGPRIPEERALLAGENVIDASTAKIGKLQISDAMLLFDFDDPDDPKVSYFGDAMPLDMEVGLLNGDSGGGLFLKKDGKWFLAGVLNFSPPRSGDLDEPHSQRPYHNRYGQIGGAVRVSSKIEWIRSVINEANE